MFYTQYVDEEFMGTSYEQFLFSLWTLCVHDKFRSGPIRLSNGAFTPKTTICRLPKSWQTPSYVKSLFFPVWWQTVKINKLPVWPLLSGEMPRILRKEGLLVVYICCILRCMPGIALLGSSRRQSPRWPRD